MTQARLFIILWLGVYLCVTFFYSYKHAIQMGYGFPIVQSYDAEYEYIGATVYLFKQGRYWTDCRMPGFAIIYSLFYAPTRSERFANLAYVLLCFGTLLLSIGISLLYVLRRTQQVWILHCIGFLWATNPIVHRWPWVETDAMAIGTFSLGLLALFRAHYLLSGLLLALTIFLRPITGVILPFVGLRIWAERGFPLPWQWLSFRAIWITFLPFLLMESAWIMRNYYHYADLRPFHGTRTIFNEPCHDTPAREGYPLLIRLGMATDNTLSNLFAHGRGVDSSIFMTFVPQKYLSSESLKLLQSIISKQAVPDSQKSCEYLLEIEIAQRTLACQIAIPPHVRIYNRLRHAFLGDIAHLHQETSFLNMLLYAWHHPLHTLSAVAFVGLHLAFMWLLLRVILGLSSWISLVTASLGFCPMWAHLAIGIVDHRYLTTYVPIAALTLIVGWQSSKPRR
ncbi:MAG: hypothetical protein RMK19_01600 [Bacteroidia bacterium]|nr:hypothetical protein [Bacteroidia bacterium]MDW8014688.1 hypothetical protein [Bacteroidia bacterium]